MRPTGPRRLWPCASPLRPGGVTHLCRGRAGEPPDPEKSPWKGAARTAREVSPWDTGTSRAPPQRKPEKPRAELCVNVRLVASSALGPPCSLGSGQGVSEAGTTPHQPHRQQDRGGRTAGGEGRLAPSPSQGPCCHTHVHTQTRTHRHTCTHMPTDTCTQTHAPQTHAHRHMPTDTCARRCRCMHTHVHTHTCPQTQCTHIGTHAHRCTCTCTHVHMHTCAYTDTCTHPSTHTGTLPARGQDTAQKSTPGPVCLLGPASSACTQAPLGHEAQPTPKL